MTGYVRVDTSNNIADGNVISAADLDNEFDGIQAAFNASTGHNHDGTTGEGAPISVLGPTQDVVVGASTVTPKTTNTVDIGSSSLKFKDLYLAGNASIGGTLAVTGVATLTAQPILSSLTASRAVFTDGSKGLVSNAITGTGNVVMSASPTLTGTITAAALTTSSTVTLNGGTANGVAYLNGSKVLTTGSALTFDGTTLTLTASDLPRVKFTGSTGGGDGWVDTFGTALRMINNAASGNMTLQTNGQMNLTTVGNSPIIFSTANAEQMRLTSTGLGIGTSSPTNALSVTGSANITGNTTLGDATTDTVTVNGYMGVGGAGNPGRGIQVVSTALTGGDQIGVYSNATASSSATTALRSFYSVPKTAIAAFTCANIYGFSADDASLGAGSSVTNLVGVQIADQTQGTNNYGIRSLVSSGTNKWNIYASGTADNYFAGRVGFGTTSLGGGSGQYRFSGSITGATTSSGLLYTPTIQSDATANAYVFHSQPSTAAAAFTITNLVHYHATQATIGAGSTVTNQFGFNVQSTLTGATNNYGFYGGIASGTGRWNLYMAGTADNYFAGNVGIGTSSPQQKLQVSGGRIRMSSDNVNGGDIAVDSTGLAFSTLSTTQPIIFLRNNYATESMRIDSSGNVGIGTSSPVGNLDVAGTTPTLNIRDTQSKVSWAAGDIVATLDFYSNDTSGVGAQAVSRIRSVADAASAATSGALAFWTAAAGAAATEKLRITSAGNVGIGTSSPSSLLDVVGSSAGSQLVVQRVRNSGTTSGTGSTVALQTNTNSTAAITLAAIDAVSDNTTGGGYFAIRNTTSTGNLLERLRIDSSGNLGVGTTSPTARIHSNGTIQSVTGSTGIQIYGDGGTGYVNSIGAYPLVFQVNSTERARIDSSGNLLVGTTASGGQSGFAVLKGGSGIETRIEIAHNFGTASGVKYVDFLYATGSIGSITQNGTTAVAYNTSSDYRLKNITGPITNSGAYIDSLNPVEGTWKADGSTFVGLIAHEVQEASRTTVATGVKDGEEMQGMDYSSAEIIANLIAEVKSLRQRLAAAGI